MFVLIYFLIKPPFNQSEQNVFTQKKKKNKEETQCKSPDGTGKVGRENEDRINMQKTKMYTLQVALLHRYMQGQFAPKGND